MHGDAGDRREAGPHRAVRGSVSLGGDELALLLEALAFKRLALLVADGRGLFKILAALPLTDDAFALHQPLEALECFFQKFVFSDDYVCDELFLP